MKHRDIEFCHVRNQKNVVMTTSTSSLLLLNDILVVYKNIQFLVRKLKKGNIFEILPLLTFTCGHQIYSGHEHEKGGNFDNFYVEIIMIF